MDKAKRARRIMFVVSCIPLFIRKAFFRALAFLFYLFFAKHRLITLSNLSHAFHEKSIAERKRIARGAYANLAITAAEFFDIPFFSDDDFQQRVKIEGKEFVEEALKRGKGVLVIGLHLSNWEFQVTAAAVYLRGVNVVYRRLDSDLLEEIAMQSRRGYGRNKFITTGSSGKAIREALARNEIVGLLMDQNTDVTRGVFVDFFGRPACSAVATAALAIQTGAAVVPFFLIRQKSGKYKFLLKPSAPIDNTGDYEKDLRTNTQRFVKMAEEVIREYPEQWFWLHQRWKTKRCQL